MGVVRQIFTKAATSVLLLLLPLSPQLAMYVVAGKMRLDRSGARIVAFYTYCCVHYLRRFIEV